LEHHDLALCFAVQSSIEEIVFRAGCCRRSRPAEPRRGLVLTSLVFTLLHFDLHQPWLFT